MNNKKKQIVLMLIALFGLIVITAGVTYAFFSYAKEGTTDNTVTTGTITFLYTEVSGVGKGISINDAYPISDTQGKAQTGEGKVFDFKITSNNNMDASIPYEVTARKKVVDNMLDEDAVKIYLTKVNADVEEEVLLSKYSDLEQTDKVLAGDHVEKTIYNGKVPANQTEKYEQNFRLRMWIDKDVKFSPIENEDGTITYPYNDKEFTITVNVYANAKVVTDEDIEAESKAEISTLTVGGTELTKVEDQAYHYETSLPEGTTSTTIEVETQSEYATVEVEKLEGLAYSNSVKRLSTKKTLELDSGNNYFKITVISENKDVVNEYIIKIFVGNQMGSSTSLSVGQAVTAIDGSKWHVLEASASGTETVVLLSDYNLNDDGSYNEELEKVGRVFDPSTGGTFIYYDPTEKGNIGYFIKNTYEPLVLEALPGTTSVGIPTMSQILAADGQEFNQTSVELNNSWLNTTTYWTNTKMAVDPGYSTLNVWRVMQNAAIKYTQGCWPDAGARPVITTLKSNLVFE